MTGKGLSDLVVFVIDGMDLAFFIKEEQGMLDEGILKEIISILMQSASYFCLTVQERLFIIKHLMKSMGMTAKYKGGSNV